MSVCSEGASVGMMDTSNGGTINGPVYFDGATGLITLLSHQQEKNMKHLYEVFVVKNDNTIEYDTVVAKDESLAKTKVILACEVDPDDVNVIYARRLCEVPAVDKDDE